MKAIKQKVKGCAMNGKRRKIWEISQDYHCSLIGTCIYGTDLLRFAKKIGFATEPGLLAEVREYQIHSFLVYTARQMDSETRLLQKTLDKKYQQAIRRYSKASTAKEIESLWKEDVRDGSLQGAYWAIMTHPCVDDETERKFYSIIHMKSYNSLNSNGIMNRNVQKYVDEIALLKNRITSDRTNFDSKIDEMLTENESLRKQVVELKRVEIEKDSLMSELEKIKLVQTEIGKNKEIEKLRDELDLEKRKSEQLTLFVKKQERQLTKQENELQSISAELNKTEEDNTFLKNENITLLQEIKFLESAFFSAKKSDCADCIGCDAAKCSGKRVCNKRLLYVGGQDRLVPYYKKVAEQWGGELIHHDGGRGEAMNRLHGMLSQADIVVCPVDCVSHDACNCLKKICKRHKKPFVMMRSSGISSLSRSLRDLETEKVQT